ncbi:MAG: thioesterase [Candidatus Saccharicenans sp.]|jgi:acyl-ACP thioesterase|nr:thioesterase [Candidatus Saccharicenans sp.]MDH7492804.1 thioesterase [Candidatus Saccharicenans sp.]
MENQRCLFLTADYEILSIEADYLGRAHLSALMNYMQDAARRHSVREKFSVFDLAQQGLTWVVSRYHIAVDRYPQMGEKITIKTWASGKHGYFALRDFEIYDAGQQKIALATSSWMIIELESRRPVRVENLFPDELILQERALEDEFPTLPIVERLDHRAVFRVMFEDLDYNRHVNNVVYSRWAVEGLPRDILFSGRPQELEINYRSEAFYGDEIEVITQTPESPGGFWVQQIYNLTSGKEVSRIRSRWKSYGPGES